MQIHLDHHGILEISMNDEKTRSWSNYQVLLDQATAKELKEKLEEFIE